MAKKPAVAQPEDLAQAKSSDQSVAAVTSFAPDSNNGASTGAGVGVEPAVNSSGLVSGLTLYTSNQMENLADLCALLMSEYPQKDAFAHERIVVMNLGMHTYLTQRIAMQNQIAALCDFHQVWQLIYRVHRILHPNAPQEDLFNRDHLTWNLYSLICQMLATPAAPVPAGGVDLYAKLRHYLQDDLYGDKAYELAAKIADTLDQYQMYRPQWIKAWNAMPLRVFDEYERDPNNASNPINVFISDVCRKLVRVKSGVKNQPSAGATAPVTAVASAAAEAASASAGEQSAEPVASLLNADVGGGISRERVGMVRSLFESNVWQIKLWCLLRHNLNFYGEDDLTPLLPNSPELMWRLRHLDRSQVMTSMIAELNAGNLSADVTKKLADRVFVFGVSALPRIVVQFFAALSRYCNVNIMLLEPCREYWGDIYAHNSNDFARYVNMIKATTQPLKTKNKRFAQKFLSLPTAALQRHYKLSDYDLSTGERISGNPLLLSLGKQGRDNLHLFYELDTAPNNIACFSEPDLPAEARPYSTSVRTQDNVLGAARELVEVRGGTLLNYIQLQLLELEQKSERYIIDPSDQSLQIHACHTKRREVEVLHDAILACFNEAKLRGEKLYPRDIVVMVPAINDYSPHISAVFGGAYKDGDPDYIPFVISDMTENEANTVAQSLLKLMDISTKRVTAAMVVELLSENAIARRFGLSRDDVEVISTWLSDTFVYWGLDGEDVAPYAEIKIPGTFAQGLERMILGSLLGDDQVMPCFSEIEGSDSQTLGKLWDFLLALRELRQRFTPELALTPDEWANELQIMLTERFFASDPSTTQALEAVNKVIEELKVTINHIYYKPKINLPVFAAALRQGLVAQRNFQPFLREKVNLCSLVPMRAVPFTHVFILGLNDMDFPREEQAPGFNLMSARDLFERGDRSRNLDDRFLFLEALLSARKSLYLSYIGQSPVDKTEKNPSIVLDELMYYISDHCAVEGDNTSSDGERQKHVLERIRVVEHLNAYQEENYVVTDEQQAAASAAVASPAAAKGSDDAAAAAAATVAEVQKQMPRRPSFNKSFIMPSHELKQDAAMLGAGVFFNEDFIKLHWNKVLELSELLSFVTKPSQFFLRNLLGISFPRNNNSQQEDEAFNLDGFEINALVQEILKIPPEQRQAYLDRKGELGELPYGIFKQELLSTVMEHADNLTAALKSYLGVSSLAEIQEFACPKTIKSVLVPCRYFAGAPLPRLIELNDVSLSDKAKADAAVAGQKLDGGKERAMVNSQVEDCYRFVLTLQANYHEQPFVLSVFKAVGNLSKQKGLLTPSEDTVLAYPEVLKCSSLVFQALSEAIAYYLRYGTGKDVLIVDSAGESFCLKAFTPEQMDEIITTLLIFYVLGLTAPFPCCQEVLCCTCFTETSGDALVISPDVNKNQAGAAYLTFDYDVYSSYLYGSIARLLEEPTLESKAAAFVEFYITMIASHFAPMDN